MKLPLATVLLVGLMAHSASGQGAQADMIKRRAKETVNQNNVRQGVPAPAQNQPRPPAAGVSAASPAVTQAQSLANIKSDLVGFKTGSVATTEQKQRFTINLARAARGTKPTLGTVKKFVESISTALKQATFSETADKTHAITVKTPDKPDLKMVVEQNPQDPVGRLAQNIEAALNAKPFPAAQFDKIIEDTQAILEVGTVKRTIAIGVAADLKAVGLEVRR